MMSHRQMLMMLTEEHGLPSEYLQVEYLESTGTQYIDSGIECTSDLCVDFSFLIHNKANSAICGGIKTSTAPTYFRHHCTPDVRTIYWIQNNSSSTPAVTGITYDTDAVLHVTVDPVQGVATVNNETKTFTALQSGLTTGKGFGIFGRIADTGAVQIKSARIYYFKFYRNGKLIGDFIPCIRISDSKPGMYELVGRQFYVNEGTGEFLIPTT